MSTYVRVYRWSNTFQDYGWYWHSSFTYRCDPVPGTGGVRGCCGWRNMHTTQERRFSGFDDHKPYVRGRRSKRMIPNAWDDIVRQRRGKGWKNCSKRKRQWKPKTIAD